MRSLNIASTAAVAAAAAAAGVALASGGPPPTDPPAPDPRTVVAHGTGIADVAKPPRQTDTTIERAVVAARSAAVPRAVAAARREAESLARAAGMQLTGPIGVARDAAPVGYWEPDSGRFGPGRHCGRLVTWRTVRRADGTRRRVRRARNGCVVPKNQSVRITLTYAAAG